jgi:hypothetical protein
VVDVGAGSGEPTAGLAAAVDLPSVTRAFRAERRPDDG